MPVDGFHYLVYVSSCLMKCFGWGQTGHLVRACPDGTGTPADGEGESNKEQTPSVEFPNREGAEANAVGGDGGDANVQAVGEGESSSAEVSLLRTPAEPAGEDAEPAGEDAEQAEPESRDVSQNSVAGDDDLTDGIDAEEEGSQIDAEDEPVVFKVPQKGKKRTQGDETVKAKNILA